jgi:acetyl-CoA carboxylase carboxyl transferase subunit beta
MNWLTNFIRPRINSIVPSKEVPDNLWQKCPSCEGMLFHRDLEESSKVCYHCGHHLRITVKERLNIMFDDGKYEKIELPKVAHDPLKFKDQKKYVDRLRDAQHKTGLKDAMTIAKGKIGGQKAVIAAFNFSFMGGSMGMAVGEAIVKAAEVAVKEKAALITVPSSGGARMQEGMLSLVQMPRSIIAVEMVKEAGLPYIVLLTDPTTGGVSASFAMVGDIHLAEPGSTIGFAGRRVIEETVRETLPDDFQTAEYLLEHGIVDMVVQRGDLRHTIGRLLGLLMDPRQKAKKAA